ncbi:hypothetical protein [Aeromicrobium sp. IC_218]|uniref:hypothetical protein n=1 Tax=Aeromicrobium sp. IC_218 TaxID=2545468 RepID=UPI001A95566A|nr:hypothetical protein [Aeromicrobium sp. IC_218]
MPATPLSRAAEPADPRSPASPTWVAGDLLRAAALVSLAVAVPLYGFVGAALFLLVLGGTMLPRALGLPTALDVPFCATILLAAWAAQLDWYEAVDWLDLVVHAVATGLVAAVAHLTLARVRLLPEPGAPRSRLASAMTTVALGLALAVVWEVGEWLGHTYLDDRIQVGTSDTVGDLLAGALGAVAAAVPLSRRTDADR